MWPVPAPCRFLLVGRAVPKKGFDTLIRALAQLPAGLDWRFTHAGGGAELHALEALSDELGVADRMTWLGSRSQDELLTLYRDADIFALASRVAEDGDRDGLPNVLMEAQSQEVAVIATHERTRVEKIGRVLDLPSEAPLKEIQRLVTIFRELRNGKTEDGKTKLK